jgi:energy-coupling factor transporter ATP-binding protein EcfA2
MKLTSARIRNFRSIHDSGPVEIGEVACLVGKNESGKTNFLEALARTKPAYGVERAFDTTRDYPRKDLVTFEQAQKKPGYKAPPVINVTYTLSDDEQAELATEFGPVAGLADGTVDLTVRFDGARTWTVGADEAAVVAHFVAQYGVDGAEAKACTDAKTVLTLAAGEDATEELREAAAAIETWRGHSATLAIIDWLSERQPLFLYFGDYDRMKGEGNVRKLLEAEQGDVETLDAGERTFLSLLKMAGTTLEDLDEENYERIKARLESISGTLTTQLYDAWRQNANSEIEVDHTYEDRTDGVPGKDLILKVRVKDKRHGHGVPVDRRSSGFVWFFSFLINFSQIRDRFPEKDLVILLDEPGTSLHGLAQLDFLNVIEEQLVAQDHQVIYTTHQPFLVDPDHIERARPVIDEDQGGTKVRNNAYAVDNDTLFPLQAALGYAIGQTLFVAPNVLLVEGTSDLIYLQLLSRAVEKGGGIGLDRRWTVTPVGGLPKMATFVRLFQANQLNTAALIDVTQNKDAAIKALVEKGVFDQNQVVTVDTYASGGTKQKEADTEDVFEPAFYLDLVRTSSGPANPVLAGLPAPNLLDAPVPEEQRQERITARIDAWLRAMNQQGTNARVDHMPPARYFEAHQDELLSKINAATIKRATKLFADVNKLLTD